MIRTKEFTGFVTDYRFLERVDVRFSGRKIRITACERLEMVVPFGTGDGSSKQVVEKAAETALAGGEKDDVFGLENLFDESGDPEVEEFSFEELEEFTEADETGADVQAVDLDLVDEADVPDSNHLLLHRHLLSVQKKRKPRIALNIRSGSTVFQYIPEAGSDKLRKRELRDLVEGKLLSVHGEIPASDRYSYFSREDGKLVIASLDKEPASLVLINQVLELSGRSTLYIRDVIPEEVALTGLYRMNYPLEESEDKITALIQFREKRCRILFLRGHKVLHLPPLIHEGTTNRSFLNTLFSKILFQLDTGEVPGLDRILLCDNTLGDEAVDFFQTNFPELEVGEFRLDPSLFEAEEEDLSVYNQYTTALAVALAASGLREKHYPQLSLMPDDVAERQKVFKLHWHGVLLLICIGLTPVLINHFYQKNRALIETLQTEISHQDRLIAEMQPTVDQVHLLQGQLEEYREQLLVLSRISEGNLHWTHSFDHINSRVQQIGGIWITSFRESGGILTLNGISLYRERIPQLARQFKQVTLLDVQQSELRERSVYLFHMRVNSVLDDAVLSLQDDSARISEFLKTLD